MTGMCVQGQARVGAFEDRPLVYVRVGGRERLQLEQAGEVAPGHGVLVGVGEFAVVHERPGGAGALEGPVGAEEQAVYAHALAEELQPVVDLKRRELQKQVRVAVEQGDEVARALPARLLEEDGQARKAGAQIVHLVERHLMVVAVEAAVEEERDLRFLEGAEEQAARRAGEAEVLAARKRLRRAHAGVQHLPHERRTGRHLARLVREHHPARQQARLRLRPRRRDLVHELAVAVAGVVLARRDVVHERPVDARVPQVVEERVELPRHARVYGALHAEGGA